MSHHEHRDPTVYLLRHGETEWSRSGQHTGRTDIPLTEQGRAQAQAAGRTLAALGAKGRVLASPRGRALVTAELAGLGVDEVTEDLAEWDYGDYEGRTTPEIRRTVPDWTVWTHPCPGGESAEQVGARADRLLDRVRGLLPETDVVLVGHGHFSRVLIARWLELPATAGVRFAVGTAGTAVLGFERGVPQLRLLTPPTG